MMFSLHVSANFSTNFSRFLRELFAVFTWSIPFAGAALGCAGRRDKRGPRPPHSGGVVMQSVCRIGSRPLRYALSAFSMRRNATQRNAMSHRVKAVPGDNPAITTTGQDGDTAKTQCDAMRRNEKAAKRNDDDQAQGSHHPWSIQSRIARSHPARRRDPRVSLCHQRQCRGYRLRSV